MGKNAGMIFFTVLLAVIGAMHLAEPARMLRWTLRNNPELGENRAVLIVTRFIGLGLLVLALFILAKL